MLIAVVVIDVVVGDVAVVVGLDFLLFAVDCCC